MCLSIGVLCKICIRNCFLKSLLHGDSCSCYSYFDIFIFMVLACPEEAASMSLVTWCELLLVSREREEKTVWLDVLCKAVEDLCKRRSSFKVGKEVDVQKPPQYVKMDGVNKCMDCGAGFGVMKRKHHCRACGLVSERNEMCYKQQ